MKNLFVILTLVLMPTLAAATGLTLPTTSNAWDPIYDGYGHISEDPTAGIDMCPKASTAASETHAALLLSRFTEAHPLGNFVMSLDVVNEQQLRSGSTPNPWEVFWLFFDYQGQGSTTTITNYFIAKPNGVEFGEAYGDNGQTYLYTANQPVTTIGSTTHWLIGKLGRQVVVYLNGVRAMNYNGSLVTTPGAIGLYTEDACVRIQNIHLWPLGG